MGDAVDEDLDRLSYEQLVERLEQTVSRMASGEIGIEEVADLYERAGRIHALALERLERVRARIDALAPNDGSEPPPS